MSITFEQVVETVRQFPEEQREILVDLIRGWRIDTRRREIARDARESLASCHAGEFKSQSAREAISELHQSLEGQQ